MLLSSPLKHSLAQPRRLFLFIYFPWLGRQDLLHHLKVTNMPRHCWNNNVGKYFLTSTAMQASSSFCLVAPVPSQRTVHCSCATQHPILCVDSHFPLLKTQSRFPFTLGLHELWMCFQIPNTLTAFWKGLTVNTQWGFSCKLHCYEITNDMEMKTGQTKLQTCIFC